MVLGMYYILAANANADIPGGRSFIWQCVTYLLTVNLLPFVGICVGVIAFCWGVNRFINIMEDEPYERRKKRKRRRKRRKRRQP